MPPTSSHTIESGNPNNRKTRKGLASVERGTGSWVRWEYGDDMTSVSRVYLVSCVSQKLDNPALAQDLYTSPWFQKARRYVLKSGSPWYILSAEHGLVHPEQILAPYEKTLNTLGAAERRAWAREVQTQMEQALPEADEIILLAGARYRDHLEPWLRRRFTRVSVPMRGLQFGKQLQWLSNREST